MQPQLLWVHRGNSHVMSRRQHVTAPFPPSCSVLLLLFLARPSRCFGHVFDTRYKTPSVEQVTLLHSIARITPPGTSCLTVQYSSATDKTTDIFSLKETRVTLSRIEI